MKCTCKIYFFMQGSLGKKVISPSPSAALVRNMRKGSTDHLALDVDGESDRLIRSTDIDEDKGNYKLYTTTAELNVEDSTIYCFAGHVFQSLNTSGFVPRPGKLIADRIDGIWYSAILSN